MASCRSRRLIRKTAAGLLLCPLFGATGFAQQYPSPQFQSVGVGIAAPATGAGQLTLSGVPGGITQMIGPFTDSTAIAHPAFYLNETMTGNPPSQDVISPFVIYTTVNAPANTHFWGINNNFFSQSAAIGIAQGNTVTRQAGSTGRMFVDYGQLVDQTGLYNGGIGFELDLYENGPEPASTSYNPGLGGRVILALGNGGNTQPTWTANHAYAVGAAVLPSPTNGYTYVVTVAGTSGATQPTWPTSSGTVTDGTVTWQFGTTVAQQVSRGASCGTSDSVSEFATCLEATGPYYDAALELSLGTLDTTTNPNAAGIRLAANMPIDFSGNGTSASQNQHTVAYNSTTGNFEYRAPSAVFSIASTGHTGIGVAPQAGIDLNIGGSTTVGVTTAGGSFTTSYRMSAGQLLSFSASDLYTMTYNATDNALEYDVSGSPVFRIGNTGILTSGSSPGVTCSGTPTASFAAVGGIVTHC